MGQKFHFCIILKFGSSLLIVASISININSSASFSLNIRTALIGSPTYILFPKFIVFTSLPFEIKRVYWIYDVPGGDNRGGHSYYQNQELIIALSGSFDVVLDDGFETKKYTLNRSHFGLYVPNGIWRQLENFSTNSCALILSSSNFDSNDYILNFSDFLPEFLKRLQCIPFDQNSLNLF